MKDVPLQTNDSHYWTNVTSSHKHLSMAMLLQVLQLVCTLSTAAVYACAQMGIMLAPGNVLMLVPEKDAICGDAFSPWYWLLRARL